MITKISFQINPESLGVFVSDELIDMLCEKFAEMFPASEVCFEGCNTCLFRSFVYTIENDEASDLFYLDECLRNAVHIIINQVE